MFLFSFLDVQINFMFPTCKDSQKQVKNQKSTDKHSSFDGLIQEDLSDIYLAVHLTSFNLYFVLENVFYQQHLETHNTRG